MKRSIYVLAGCLCGASSLLDQGSPEPSPKRPVSFDGAMLLAAPTVYLASDLSKHASWGFRLMLQVHATPRFSLRFSVRTAQQTPPGASAWACRFLPRHGSPCGIPGRTSSSSGTTGTSSRVPPG